MPSSKSKRRAIKSKTDSAGDRGTGSVGERAELAGSRDSASRDSDEPDASSKLRHSESDDVSDEDQR